MSIIYKTTNLINGKFYVGQHNTSANDGYLGSGKILKQAICKYGKDNFKREILEHCDSENINEKEIFWIAELSATDKNIGYNIAIGGSGNGNRIWTDVQREHMRLLNLGKILSDETKNKISMAMIGDRNPNYGNHWNDDQKKKASELRKGIPLENETRQKIIKWASENENPFKNKTHSLEQKEKWRRDRRGTRLGEKNTFYGKTHSESSKLLIGQSSKLRTKYIYKLISPDNEIFENVLNLQDFMDKYNIGGQNNISKYKNNISKYKKWIIERKLKGDSNVTTID